MIEKFLNEIGNYYYLCKAIHIVCIILWMSGMLFLSILFSFNAKFQSHEKSYEILLNLEKNIIRVTTFNMILGSIFGFLNAYIYGFEAIGLWFWLKMIAVLFFWILYIVFVVAYKKFIKYEILFPPNVYKIISILIILSIFFAVNMVVIKPFD